MDITHNKVSSVADGPDTNLVRPSDWNAAHSPTILDEDDMASDSAVNLATQQSIKAYVDNKGKTAAIDNTTLTKDTNYQNTTGYPLLVIVGFDCAAGGIGYFKTDANATPTTVVMSAGGATVAVSSATVWVVKVGEYYRAAIGGGGVIGASQRIALGAY